MPDKILFLHRSAGRHDRNGLPPNGAGDLRAARSVDALDFVATRCGRLARGQHDSAHLTVPGSGITVSGLGIVALASATSAFVSLGETVIMVQRPHLNFCIRLLPARSRLPGSCPSFRAFDRWELQSVFSSRISSKGFTLCDPAAGISLERFLERYQFPADRRSNRNCSRSDLPSISSGVVGQVTRLSFLAVFGAQWRRTMSIARTIMPSA